ncbi:N-lysine methyltransferase SMYD2-like [Oscarella lobularis]|uniref:N-lysine methyltransferase SMYD2-like n=1 Tax=Oscarella lobularis TaxID=121494 RepID=UPI003313DF77
MGQYRRNGFGLTDQGVIDGAATSMFSKFSLFNHSCCPNVYVSNVGKTMRARAIRPIRKGEELTINYVPNLMLGTMEYRQERIRVRYLFDCKCSACTSPEAIEKNKIHTRLRYQTPGIDVRQCIDECKRIEATARAQDKANNHVSAIAIIDEFLKSSPLDRRSCYIREIASLAQASCFELNMWERTLEFGEIVTESSKTFLSSDHPTLAQHYLALCTSLRNLGRGKVVMQYMQSAVRSYEVFLGKDHPATMVYQRHLTSLFCQTEEFQEACRRGDPVCVIDLN